MFADSAGARSSPEAAERPSPRPAGSDVELRQGPASALPSAHGQPQVALGAECRPISSMQHELAVDVAPFVRRDQPLVRVAHRMQRAFELCLPEFDESEQHREFRGEIVVLPDDRSAADADGRAYDREVRRWSARSPCSISSISGVVAHDGPLRCRNAPPRFRLCDATVNRLLKFFDRQDVFPARNQELSSRPTATADNSAAAAGAAVERTPPACERLMLLAAGGIDNNAREIARSARRRQAHDAAKVSGEEAACPRSTFVASSRPGRRAP